MATRSGQQEPQIRSEPKPPFPEQHLEQPAWESDLEPQPRWKASRCRPAEKLRGKKVATALGGIPPALGSCSLGTADLAATDNLDEVRPARRVLDCYGMLDLTRGAAGGGFEDYTDGMYHGDPALPYEDAQKNQAEYLLDQARCGPGSKILDIGCGNGRVLEAATDRGATAVGITVCPRQVEHCRRKGLDARLMDYREMQRHFPGEFDGIIANGSIEHFVQPADAAAGCSDAIYRKFFRGCHRSLDPSSGSRRLTTTVIHFGRTRVSAEQAMLNPFRHRWNSDVFHYALLAHVFGGYYPVPGQLAECAAPYFELETEEDGTWDYWQTSEHWLSVAKRSLLYKPTFVLGLLPTLFRHPIQLPQMVICLCISQSWNWQFRGDDPPMRLLRQTWRAR